jgi:cysteine-rich repeat protein
MVRWRFGFVWLVSILWGLVLATPAQAVVCGANPTANPILFGCSPFLQACTISGGSAPAGCKLDFGNRKVTFTGTFDLTVPNAKAATLSVAAGQIVVQGTIKARSDDNKPGGSIELIASDSIVVSGALDVSGNSGGLMKIRAGGLFDLSPGGALRAKGLETASTGNSASGGAIDVVTGTSFAHRGSIDLGGGPGGGGGSLLVQAGTNLTISQPIDATGGEADGGDIDLTAGDDLRIERNIDVSSPTNGGGGGITARAGVDRAGGVKVGGTLTVLGDLFANGSNDADGGYDGGEIELRAFGDVNVSGALRAVGGFPDGGGGLVTFDSSDNNPSRVTNLDGDLTVSSIIDVHGPNVGTVDDSASGGDVDIFVGRDGTITGSMDLSGSDTGGDVTVLVGRGLSFGATVNAKGTVSDASGGSVTIETGRGLSGPLSVTRTLDVSAVNGAAGGISLKGCGLTLAPGLTATAKTGRPNAAPRVDLVTATTMSIGAGGTYNAEPAGRVQLVHPAATAPQIGGNVTFTPTTIESTDPALFPVCAVCGDGIRQKNEPCDNGAGADGACCNADCSAFTCPTITPTPTATPISTAPTRSATPTRTRTPTPTKTPTATITIPPTGPTPTATVTVPPTGPTAESTPVQPPTAGPTASPILPFIEPKTVLTCEKTVGKANSTLVLSSLKTLEACALESFKCIHTKPAGPDRNACLTSTGRRCDAKLAKLDATHARFRAQFIDACGGEPPTVPIELLRSTEVLGYSLLQPQCFGLDLTSPDVILGCLQILTPCEAQRALGVGVPRVGDLLSLITTNADEDTACLPPPLGDGDGLAGSPVASQTVRCQRAVATSGRKLLTRQLSVARSCVDSLLKCRLSGKPRDACLKVGASCARKLATLDDPSSGARAKMLGAIHAACGVLPSDVLREANGIGFAAIDDRCEALGDEPATDSDSMARCVTRAYGCAGSAIVRQALPLVDGELARVGLSLGNDAFCAVPTPTPTATPVRTSTRTPTPTRTATPTLSPTSTPTFTALPTVTITATPLPGATETPVPTMTAVPSVTPTPNEPPTPEPTSTPNLDCGNGVLDPGEQCDDGNDVPGDGCDDFCRFEVLIPGGGSDDCIAEWAVINPFNTPFLDIDDLPNSTQTCVDGDPSCDADGAADDHCTFEVALCLQNADPNMPTCVAPPGIAKWVIVSPRPNSSDPSDAANALAMVDSFGRLSATAASGDAGNTLVFDPPLVLAAPDNCTDTVQIVVERRGFSQRSEKFRVNTTSVPTETSRGVEDDDTLLLVCRDAPAPTPTATP